MSLVYAAVTVLPHRYVPGFPKSPASFRARDRVQVQPLAEALARRHPEDAHFACYVTWNSRRLTVDAVDHGPVELRVIAFDVDSPAVHGTSEPAPASWRTELRESLNAVNLVHPGLFAYDTRGGARLVWLLSKPTLIRSRADARRWRQGYALAVSYLRRGFAIDCDAACADWTRLYRLPNVRRDGRRDRWDTFGEPNAIGPLSINPTEADGIEAQRILPNAFSVPRASAHVPCTSGGRGLLYHLLFARGMIVRPLGTGSFVVVCPREHAHSSGRRGDTSTVLFAPIRDVGWIECLHAHCRHMTVNDWIQLFDQHEVDAARRAIGISSQTKVAPWV